MSRKKNKGTYAHKLKKEKQKKEKREKEYIEMLQKKLELSISNPPKLNKPWNKFFTYLLDGFCLLALCLYIAFKYST